MRVLVDGEDRTLDPEGIVTLYYQGYSYKVNLVSMLATAELCGVPSESLTSSNPDTLLSNLDAVTSRFEEARVILRALIVHADCDMDTLCWHPQDISKIGVSAHLRSGYVLHLFADLSFAGWLDQPFMGITDAMPSEICLQRMIRDNVFLAFSGGDSPCSPWQRLSKVQNMLVTYQRNRKKLLALF